MTESPVRGTCLFMCPDPEIEMRQREGLVHKLETRRGQTGQRVADRRKMVKMFSRSAAGKDLTNPEDLRPPPVLKRTVNYLLGTVACYPGEAWEFVYAFVTDRLRSVRQDMVVQQTPPTACRAILEPVVRFHAYSAYRLCEAPVDVFDAHLNRTQLNECLKQLLVCYDATDARKAAGNWSPAQEQAEALYGLLHLGNMDALYRLLTLMPHRDSLLGMVLKISLAHYHNDYVIVCRMLRLLPPLLACVTALHLPHIRRKALSVMNLAYSSKNLCYPLDKLTALLLFTNETEAASECRHYGLHVDSSGVHFFKGLFNSAEESSCKRLDFIDESLENIPLPELLLSVREPES